MAKFPSYETPYDYPPHLEHVKRGFCDEIHRSKAWCDRPAGHDGYHRAPRLGGKDLIWEDKNSLPKRTKR